MYDEAGITSGGSSGGGVTSADLGGGPSFGGGGDDTQYLPTTAQLSTLGPGQVGDSTIDRIKDYLGQSPIVSRGIGALLGNIIGNAFLPGIGGLIGGYLGQQKAGDYLNQYGLTRETESDYLGGTMGQPIYTPTLDSNILYNNPNGLMSTNAANQFLYQGDPEAMNYYSPDFKTDIRTLMP